MVVDIKTNYTLTDTAFIDGNAKVSEANALLASVSAQLAGIDKAIELTVNNDEESLAIAALVKTAWESLDAGFNVTVNAVDSVESTVSGTDIEDSEIQYLIKSAASGSRDFDVIAVDWQMYSTDAFVALCAFTSSMNGNGVSFGEDGSSTVRYNVSGWHSDAYDALVREAYEATDLTVRANKLRAAEELLVSEAPVIPLVYNQNIAYTAKIVSGLAWDIYGNYILTEVKQKNYERYLPEDN